MSSARRPRPLSTCLLVSVLIAVLFPMNAFGSPFAAYQPSTPQAESWISGAADPAALRDAIAVNRTKLSSEFDERTKWADSDGTLQVMVSLTARDAAVERFVAQNTSHVAWYGDASRFLGRVTPDQFAKLLDSPAVLFVEPDYPISHFMSASSMDVRARTADASGVYSFQPGAAGSMGSLVSNIPGLTAEQVTGDGVRVAITDSGIDKTHRDFGGWACDPLPYHACESRIVKTVTTDHLTGFFGLSSFEPTDALPTGTTELASGHGAHVAGTIGGNAYYTRDLGPDAPRYGGDGHVMGIAPNSDLISVKNGDTIWAGLSFFALQWQVDHADEFDIKVSSNSWGCIGGCAFNPNSITALVQRDLYEAGVVTVFAAGNDDGSSAGEAFAGDSQSPYVLSVAAYDDATDQLANFSSRGNTNDDLLPDPETWSPSTEPATGYRRPDLGAPGVSIWSARTLTGGAASIIPRVWLGDARRRAGGGFVPYVTMSGTSMATPHVAGAAAVLFGACEGTTNLDVMRAILVGANPTKVTKTGGGTLAEAYEVGYGSLDVRAALDRLLALPKCGGSQAWPDGSGPDPDPTTSPSPTGPPCEGVSDETASSETSYYFHRSGAPGSALNEVDSLQDGAGFDEVSPTDSTPAASSDVPLFGASDPEPPERPIDAAWTGTVDGRIRCLTFDLFQKNYTGEAVFGTADYEVRVIVGSGAGMTEYQVEDLSAPGSDEPITHVRASLTKMFGPDGPDPGTEPDLVDLSIDAEGKPVTIMLRDFWLFGPATILYDSVDFPSGFVVNEGLVEPTPSPTATEPVPADTTVAFTDGSADAGYYSDEATIAARLTDDTGAPIAGAELAFELTGENGVERWTATTDADGVGTATRTLTGVPGTYNLTVEYAGQTDVYNPDSDQQFFTIEKEQTVTTLDVRGKGKSRTLTATLNEDDSPPLAGQEIVFYADGTEIGRATTNGDGVATLAAPPGWRGDHYLFEARFAGTENYQESSGSDQT